MSTTHSEAETRAAGNKLARQLPPGSFVALSGELGAGKTTFIQGVLEALGTEPPYTSPTFVIMKLYELAQPSSQGIQRIYHADAYRVEEGDLKNAGLEEWQADPQGLVLLEWPEKIANLLPVKRIEITLESPSPTERNIRVKTEVCKA